MVNNNQYLAMEAAQNYLSIVKGASINSWMEIWDEDAIVEFPYAPPPYPKQVKGKNAICEHYKNVSGAMELCEEKPLVFYPSSDPLLAVFETSMIFRIPSTGNDYSQDYISVVKVNEDGKIVLYREYWDPSRVLKDFPV
ncbi:putative protein YesE [Sporomusa rhizae]|uniref:nuclear transport factor 2 family protein n=1 Tax=Sporomusa rhizae TaxID=357999 RepID=UPI00352AFDAA